MSFILDALKKLEQKRQRGSVPDLTTIHTAELEEEQKRPIWPYLVALALILNAGILLAWLRPWQSQEELRTSAVMEQEERTVVAAASPEPEKSPPKNSVVAPPSPTVNKPQQSAVVPDRIEEEEVPAETEFEAIEEGASDGEIEDLSPEEMAALVEEAQDVSTGTQVVRRSASDVISPSEEELRDLRARIKEEQTLQIKSLPVEPEPTKASEPESNEIKEFSQLPPSVQEDIPKLSILAHIYSDSPASRLVNVNGIIVREGETVSGGIGVEEITESGVIFTFREHRFRMRAF